MYFFGIVTRVLVVLPANHFLTRSVVLAALRRKGNRLQRLDAKGIKTFL
jgi:hypothetical protein